MRIRGLFAADITGNLLWSECASAFLRGPGYMNEIIESCCACHFLLFFHSHAHCIPFFHDHSTVSLDSFGPGVTLVSDIPSSITGCLHAIDNCTALRYRAAHLPIPARMVYTIVVHLYAKDDADTIHKLKAKLVEASQVYSQDKETLSWFVMQDVNDARRFTIVERYLNEGASASRIPTAVHALDC
jgi:hypothetical protein